MKKLPVEIKSLLFVAVRFVAHHGMHKVLGVHSYLMSSAGVQPEFRKAVVLEPFQDFVVGDRLSTAVRDSHKFSVSVASRYKSGDAPLVVFKIAFEQCKVFLDDSIRGNLFGQFEVRPIVFRYNHNARRIFVQPMHNAGTNDAVYG